MTVIAYWFYICVFVTQNSWLQQMRCDTSRWGQSSFLKTAITILIPLCPPQSSSHACVQSQGQRLDPATHQHPLRLNFPSKPSTATSNVRRPLVRFPACFLTLVPSPWPPPGLWSTCLRAPPPAPHYHMNAGREGPAEAWTPTEGNGFAIHSSSTSSHSLYTGTGRVISMMERGTDVHSHTHIMPVHTFVCMCVQSVYVYASEHMMLHLVIIRIHNNTYERTL